MIDSQNMVIDRGVMTPALDPDLESDFQPFGDPRSIGVMIPG